MLLGPGIVDRSQIRVKDQFKGPQVPQLQGTWGKINIRGYISYILANF